MGGFDRKWEENGQRDENALPYRYGGFSQFLVAVEVVRIFFL